MAMWTVAIAEPRLTTFVPWGPAAGRPSGACGGFLRAFLAANYNIGVGGAQPDQGGYWRRSRFKLETESYG